MMCPYAFPEPKEVPQETLRDARDLYEVFMQCLETFVQKNIDYGASWKKAGLVGLLVRLQDKIERALNISKNGMEARVRDERLEDTLRDAITYMGMAVIWLERQKNEKRSKAENN